MCIVCAGGSPSGTGTAAPAAAPASWSLEQIIANLDRNLQGWAGGDVIFSFFNALSADNQGDADYEGFQVFTAAQKSAVYSIVSLLTDVAGLTFTEMPDNGTSDGRVTFSNSTTMPDYVWGWASGSYYLAPPGQREDLAAQEVWVNTDGGVGSYALGTYNYMALMHEFLHALGVPHPGEYNANEDEDITYATHAEYAQDSRQYTIMSYFEAEATGAQHGNVFAAAPLLHDIAILQHIYGANMATRTGNTVYGFNSNAGRAAFDFSTNAAPVVAIWDAGGIDTLDLSGYSTTSVIDLRAGGFSSFAGLTKNLAIAYGAVIENAVGGAGNDTIYGNAVANVINGGRGADRLEGFAGDDTYYVDDRGDKVIEAASGGYDHVISSVNFNLGGTYVEKMTLTGSAVYGTGNSLNNLLIGNDRNNGLNGGTGADEMRGGKGDDTYAVDNKGDRVVELNKQGYDTVKSSVDFNMGGSYLERLELTGSAKYGVGNSLNNVIVGNNGDNILSGGGGHDAIKGGLGADRLTGGSGSERFIFDTLAELSLKASDRITDLAAEDRIDLRNIDANSLIAGQQDFSLVDAFTRKAGQMTFTYDAAGDITSLWFDVNGDGVADGLIRMNGDHRDFDNFLL